ncbi:MAG: hypothetical protein WA190_00990 [Usitatibacter sp.]
MRHFLYLTNTRLVSLLASGRSIVSRREFAVSGAGAAAFERYLAQVPSTPLRIFTDLSEEDLRLDTIPHVGAGDRVAIVGRKLAQIYRNTPYRYAQVQGRETEGRRDDRVIYTAITNPEALRVWLEMIERLKVPLEGIYSAAVASGALLDELDLLFPHALLVTFTPGDAMRQTYFRDREIKFSRLTPIDLGEGQTLGGMIAEETTRTWQYLDSLRSFAHDDRLEVCVLVHRNDRANVESALRDFAQLQYRLLDMDEVAIKLGLKPPPLDSTAEEVMVHLFLLRKVPNHFATPEMRRYATHRSARILLTQLSACALAASVAWGAWNVWRIFQETESDQRVSQQVTALNRETDDILHSLPSFGVGGTTMRDAVTFYNGALRGYPTLTDFLLPISGVLRGYPDVKLTQISWLATDDPRVTPRIKATTLRDPPPVKSASRAVTGTTSNAAATTEDSPNPPFVGGRYEVALIEATVRVPSNDFRAARAEVERLAGEIGQVEGFRVDVVDSPLDTSPSLELQGHLLEREPSFMESRFVLRVTHERDRSGT